MSKVQSFYNFEAGRIKTTNKQTMFPYSSSGAVLVSLRILSRMVLAYHIHCYPASSYARAAVTFGMAIKNSWERHSRNVSAAVTSSHWNTNMNMTSVSRASVHRTFVSSRSWMWWFVLGWHPWSSMEAFYTTALFVLIFKQKVSFCWTLVMFYTDIRCSFSVAFCVTC